MRRFISLKNLSKETLFLDVAEIESVSYIEADEKGDTTTISMRSGKIYFTEVLAQEIIEAMRIEVKAIDI